MDSPKSSTHTTISTTTNTNTNVNTVTSTNLEHAKELTDPITNYENIINDPESQLSSSITLPKPTVKEYTKLQKNLILLLVAIAGMAGPISSAIYFPALNDIQKDLHTTPDKIDITVSSFLFLMALTPLIWGGLSDLYSRRWVYIISYAIFTLSSLACGFSPSIDFLIGMRVLQGIGASSALVTGVGTLSDIFPRSERGSVMGIFFIGPLIGPVLGPIVGGYLNQYLGWRSIFYFLTALGAVLFSGLAFLLPETLAESARQPLPFKFSLKPMRIQRNGPLFNPIEPLFYLKYIPVSLAVFYACIIFASYYCVSSNQTRSFTAVYNLTSSEIGLSYIPLGIGNILGSIVGGKVSDILLARASKKLQGQAPPPEIRLHGVIGGSFSITAGLFMLGWFLEFEFPLPATLFAQFLIGFGMTNVFSGTSTYLVDLFPQFASSISATNNCLRTISAAIITSVNSKMVASLDFSWTFSLFAFLQLVGIACLLTLILYGSKLRNLSEKR